MKPSGKIQTDTSGTSSGSKKPRSKHYRGSYQRKPIRTSREYSLVTEKQIEQLKPNPDIPLLVIFLALWEEMSSSGKEEILTWINGFLNQLIPKGMGVAGAIEILMNSMLLEARKVQLDSPREVDVAAAYLMLNRGFRNVKINGVRYESK